MNVQIKIKILRPKIYHFNHPVQTTTWPTAIESKGADGLNSITAMIPGPYQMCYFLFSYKLDLQTLCIKQWWKWRERLKPTEMSKNKLTEKYQLLFKIEKDFKIHETAPEELMTKGWEVQTTVNDSSWSPSNRLGGGMSTPGWRKPWPGEYRA